MSHERKKIVKSTSNRKDRNEKLKEALAKKPTASHVNNSKPNPSSEGQISDFPDLKAEFLRSRIQKNAKKKRFSNQRPESIHTGEFLKVGSIRGTSSTSYMESSVYDGTSTEWITPSWFRNEQPVDVSIIIPLYKSDGVINDLIKTFPINNRLSWEIIFIDDQCPKNSKSKVLQLWSQRQNELTKPVGKIIYNTSNKGYGQSCNAGVNYALGKYLIFLNADTRVTPNWMEPMINLFEDPKVGIVGNMHIKDGGSYNGTIDSAGSEWKWNDMSFVHIARHSYHKKSLSNPFRPDNCPEDLMKVSEREMVTGCCFAMKAELFKYIGGFNPNYRIGYWEDSEICMNVRELGFKILYQPQSVIYHKLGHTSSGGHRYFRHNQSYFMNKWVRSHRLDDLLLTEARPKNVDPVKNILIRRLTAHGDALVASGVCAALKKKYPEAKIRFTTLHPEVLKDNPYIDEIIEFRRMHSTPFDLFYNLDYCYEWRPNINILTAYAEAVGVKTEDCVVYIDKKPVDFQMPLDYVVIHAGRTDWAGRDWPHQNFVELSQRLMKAGQNVISIGKHSEKEIPCTMDIKGKTSVAQMGYVIANAKAFVGIDSFPMHVAMAVDTPGVSFFGCVKPELRIYNKSMKGITAKNLACIGCHHRRPAPSTTTKSCEIGTLACLKEVSVDDMLKELEPILSARRICERSCVVG